MKPLNQHTKGAFLFGILFFLIVIGKTLLGYEETDSPIYVTIYMIMTILSSFLALMIAVQAWLYTRIGDSSNNLILAGVFLAIGSFDMLHLLTFPGLPASTFTTLVMSKEYWFLARFTELGMLLLLILQRRTPIQLQHFRGVSILLSMFYIAAVVILTFVLNEVRPEGLNITLIIQIGTVLLAVAHIAIVIWLKFGRKGLYLTHFENSFILPIALYYLFFYLTLFAGEPGHITYILSHLVKFGALSYLFVLLYIQFGERPYREIERLSNRYERFLNTVGEGIFGIDLQGKVTFINEAGCQMLGYRRDELVKRIVHPIIHHTKKNGKPYYIEDSPVYLSLETGEFSVISDEVFWRKDGSSFPVEYFVQPVFENGKNSGVLVTFRDMTEALKLKKLEQDHQAVQVEIGLAAKVQNDLFEVTKQKDLPTDIGVISIPYKELNGDFYTVIPNKKEILFGVADVSGKGLPAAIQMTMMQFAMEMRETPKAIMEKVNAFSYTYMEASRFITMFKGAYHLESNTLTYSSAGHEPGIVYNRKNQTFYELMPTGPILGILENAVFENRTIQLQEGDILLLFTDGLTERKKNKTDDGVILRKALQQVDLDLPAAELAQAIFDRVNDLEPHPVEDDQTLFILKV